MFLPNFLSPRLKHQFIVVIEGIESYKIASVEFPKTLKPYHGGLSGGSISVGIILSSNGTDESTEGQVVQLCKKKNIPDVLINMLDSTGTTTCTYTLNQCSISDVKLPILSYNSNGPLEWLITIAFKRLNITTY